MNAAAVCSWSLRPESPTDLVEKVLACGARAVQLHLDPVRSFEWRADETAGRLRVAGIRIVSGMMSMKGEDYSTLDTIKSTGGVRPEATWPDNHRAAEGNAILAQRFGLNLVTFHAGFLPHDRADAERQAMVARLREMAGIFGHRNVRVAFETGQESAPTLLDVLAEINETLPHHHRVGVNFDPANMILYGMGDPVESLRLLMPHIMQVHLKDATPTTTPGQWGAEVPVGTGAINWKAFFGVLHDAAWKGNLCIEREAGEQRIEDIRSGLAFVAPFIN